MEPQDRAPGSGSAADESALERVQRELAETRSALEDEAAQIGQLQQTLEEALSVARSVRLETLKELDALAVQLIEAAHQDAAAIRARAEEEAQAIRAAAEAAAGDYQTRLEAERRAHQAERDRIQSVFLQAAEALAAASRDLAGESPPPPLPSSSTAAPPPPALPAAPPVAEPVGNAPSGATPAPVAPPVSPTVASEQPPAEATLDERPSVTADLLAPVSPEHTEPELEDALASEAPEATPPAAGPLLSEPMTSAPEESTESSLKPVASVEAPAVQPTAVSADDEPTTPEEHNPVDASDRPTAETVVTARSQGSVEPTVETAPPTGVAAADSGTPFAAAGTTAPAAEGAPGGLVEQADACIQAGDVPSALEVLRSVSRHPDQLDAVIARLNEMLREPELRAYHAETRLLLVDAYITQGDYDRAIKLFPENET